MGVLVVAQPPRILFCVLTFAVSGLFHLLTKVVILFLLTLGKTLHFADSLF